MSGPLDHPPSPLFAHVAQMARDQADLVVGRHALETLYHFREALNVRLLFLAQMAPPRPEQLSEARLIRSLLTDAGRIAAQEDPSP